MPREGTNSMGKIPLLRLCHLRKCFYGLVLICALIILFSYRNTRTTENTCHGKDLPIDSLPNDDYLIYILHATLPHPEYRKSFANYLVLPIVPPQASFTNMRVWNHMDGKHGCNVALVDGISRLDHADPTKNLLARALNNQIAATINETNFLINPQHILCSAFEQVRHLPGNAMAAAVSLDSNQLHVAIVGSIGLFVVRDEQLVLSLRGNDDSYFFPSVLTQHGNIPEMKIRSLDIQLGDIVMIASEGVLDNLSDYTITQKLYFGDRRDTNKAKIIVDFASQLALGIAPTPFSAAAALYGFNWRGGRPGDTSAIVLVPTKRFLQTT